MGTNPRMLTAFETIDKLSANRETLINHINSLEKKLRNYEKYEADYMAECNKYRDDYKEMRIKLSNCVDDNARIEAEFESVRELIAQKIANISECEKKLRYTNREIKICNEIRQELADLKELHNDLKERDRQASIKYKKIQNQLNELASRCTQKELQMNNEIKRLKMQPSNNDEFIAELTKDLRLINDKIKNILSKK